MYRRQQNQARASRNFKSITFLVLCLVMLGFGGVNRADDYELIRSTISAGGGRSASFGNAFEMTATIGQPATAEMSGGGFTLTGGFLLPVDCDVLAGDIDADGDLDPDDVDVFVTVLLGSVPLPAHLCRSDLDGNGVVDGRDIAPFVSAFLQPG